MFYGNGMKLLKLYRKQRQSKEQMKLASCNAQKPRLFQLGYTLMEFVMAVALLAIMMVSLYGGISSGFAVVQLARENLRGTQIMLERMEGIRLYNWNQLVYSNMIPGTFTSCYYPLATNGESKGLAYSGSMVITNATLSPAATYSSSMRMITVTLNWTNGNIRRTRSMSTYVSKNGVQNYVYNN
jgi:prepilin-type N-terminal cleavage/methylation domain-containing protein